MPLVDPGRPASEAELLVTHASDLTTMKTKDGKIVTAVSLWPYIRISFEKQTVYLKNGGVYTASAERIDPVPDWVIEQARKLSPAALASVKFTLPEQG